MSKDVEERIEKQGELYGRIARSYDNLRKLDDQNITLGTVEAKLKVLETY